MQHEPATPRCVLSIDVEDWFHILDVPSAPSLDQWLALPSRVEATFLRMLDLIPPGVSVTCFFLGWVAEHHPDLVKEAVRRGHEIASHGYAHELTNRISREQFRDDIRRAKGILEEVAGARVVGYRSPGFSYTQDVAWFFDELISAGYQYDSSVFPARHGHGGIRDAQTGPHAIQRPGGQIIEFPVTVASLAGRRMCFFGGGYLRLFPYWVIRRKAHQVLAEHRPVVFYVHPREIDPEQPRLPMSVERRFRSYVNLRTTEGKVRAIVGDFELTTLRQLAETMAAHSVAANRRD